MGSDIKMDKEMDHTMNRKKVKEGGREMKTTRDMAKKGLYVGTGAGLVLFALAGLLPGSLIGGVIGLKIIGAIFGGPLTSAILPRIILALSMVTGVIGYSIGFLMDSVRSGASAGVEAPATAKK
jgi:hypothetical protein